MSRILPFLILLAACGGATESTPKTKPAAEAAATVVPGSHEDWCVEHAVAESQCTQCNKALIAAFKATGDWCDEHGLPESQCKKCNPDIVIKRPPKTKDSK